MKKLVFLVIVFPLLFCNGCRDYASIDLSGDTAEEIMAKVEKNKNVLDKINAEYVKRTKYFDVYVDIGGALYQRWATPKMMSRWYKICLNSISKSKESFNNPKNINEFSCYAFICFIGTNDNKAIKDLPELTVFPLFEEARKKYLHSNPKEFLEWCQQEIVPTAITGNKSLAFAYCGLLESAALLAGDYEMAKNANQILLHREYGGDLETGSVSNIAFYSDKLGKITPEDRKIMLDYYNEYIKGKKPSRTYKKRDDFIVYALKKYKIIPELSKQQQKADTKKE